MIYTIIILILLKREVDVAFDPIDIAIGILENAIWYFAYKK